MARRLKSIELGAAVQRKLAIDLFNFTWTLIEKPNRTPRETDRMIDIAHASRFFWESIGEPAHHARGEWQISRAYAVAGRAEPALHHAMRSLVICQENGIGDFDLAFAYEALARAHAIAGDKAVAADWARRAREAETHIAKQDDREALVRDLGTLPI
jgi:hypothetical protein